MNTQEILQEINSAATSGGNLLIEKYITSDGAIKDYVVRLLPDNGYKNLVQQSLDMLNEDANKFLRDLKPTEADTGEWVQAVSEQIDSFVKTLKPSPDAPVRNYTKELVKMGAAYVDKQDLDNNSLNTIVLKNLEVLSSVNHTPDKLFKSPKGNIPKYKELIRKELPISKYLGQLNLAPEKVTSVRAVQL